MVPRYKHEAWHILFDSYPAPKVIETLNHYLYVFGLWGDTSFNQEKRAAAWVGDKKSNLKKKCAWETFTENHDLESLIQDINDVWIDPVFEIITGQIKMVQVIQRE
jgi:hypothetical protein